MNPQAKAQRSLRGILVTDFDGTMSRVDFYRVVLGTLVPEEIAAYWEEYWAGRITHFEALRHIFGRISGTPEQYEAAMTAMDFDPAAADAIRRLGEQGWAVVVTSAGCCWYIERLFMRAGVRWRDGQRVDRSAPAAGDVILHSNPGSVSPNGALIIELPTSNPFHDPGTGIDKPGIVDWALGLGVDVAFAGDGKPDEAPALKVADNRRFARGWLAEKLAEDKRVYAPFDRWSEVVDHLLGTGEGE